MKAFHDKNTMRNSFKPSKKKIYNLRLNLSLGKFKSQWFGPYIVKTVFPHRAIEIENPNNGSVFKVNGQRLKLN